MNQRLLVAHYIATSPVAPVTIPDCSAGLSRQLDGGEGPYAEALDMKIDFI
jgi:hypothetical protein